LIKIEIERKKWNKIKLEIEHKLLSYDKNFHEGEKKDTCECELGGLVMGGLFKFC
jgi:hypothetical protein